MGSSLVITTGGGTDTSEGNPNIVESVILSGYSAYNIEGDKLIGVMPAQSTCHSNVNVSQSINIPLGYQDGTSKVSAVSLSSKTDATAGAGHVLWNYTGWKNGSNITGSMPNKGTSNGTLSANGTYTIPAGWHNGSGKVTQSLTTQGATTINPGTSNKTVVAASRWTTGNQIVAGHGGNLTAANIKEGVTIFGVTGTSRSRPSEIYVINGGQRWCGNGEKDGSTFAKTLNPKAYNCMTDEKDGVGLLPYYHPQRWGFELYRDGRWAFCNWTGPETCRFWQSNNYTKLYLRFTTTNTYATCYLYCYNGYSINGPMYGPWWLVTYEADFDINNRLSWLCVFNNEAPANITPRITLSKSTPTVDCTIDLPHIDKGAKMAIDINVNSKTMRNDEVGTVYMDIVKIFD